MPTKDPSKPRATLLAALLLGLFLTACTRQPVPVLDLKVSDGDWNDYQRSLDVIRTRQTPEERTEFAAVLLEWTLQAKIKESVAVGTEMNSARRSDLAGRTVREVLILGHTIKLRRRQDDEKALRRSIAMNQRLKTKPGDEASATFLASTHVNQAKQLETLRAEIGTIEKRLAELLPAGQPIPDLVPVKDLEEKPQRRAEADQRPT